jgi:DNA-binding PadR family transcriptional regulator
MKLLSRPEELFLLAIWRLQEDAYGVTIREQIRKVTKKTWSFGAIFITLERLVKKELIDSYLTKPTKKRGGRSKRIYFLTHKGLDALREIKEIEMAMWDGVPELKVNKQK